MFQRSSMSFSFPLTILYLYLKISSEGKKKECEVSWLLRSHYITVQVASDVLEGVVGQYSLCNMSSHAKKLASLAILQIWWVWDHLQKGRKNPLQLILSHVLCNLVHNVLSIMLLVNVLLRHNLITFMSCDHIVFRLNLFLHNNNTYPLISVVTVEILSLRHIQRALQFHEVHCLSVSHNFL